MKAGLVHQQVEGQDCQCRQLEANPGVVTRTAGGPEECSDQQCGQRPDEVIGKDDVTPEDGIGGGSQDDDERSQDRQNDRDANGLRRPRVIPGAFEGLDAEGCQQGNENRPEEDVFHRVADETEGWQVLQRIALEPDRQTD